MGNSPKGRSGRRVLRGVRTTPAARRTGAKSAGGGKAVGAAATRKPARKRRGAARPPRRGILSRLVGALVGLVWAVSWRFGAVIAVIVAVAVAMTAQSLPPADSLVDGRARGSVTFTDRGGEVFAWRGDQFGGVITAATVSPHLRNAIVATEDRRFDRHVGVDPRGIASAVRINLTEGRGPLDGHGGSTITQQTAKLLCYGRAYDPSEWDSEAAYEADCRRTSIWRKVREAVYALAMEARYSKDEILTIYMNRAYLGAGARGFQAAAERYFGKSAAALDPAEAAMLAGLLKAPTRFAPTTDLDRSRERAATIIALMEKEAYLSPAEAASARANPASLSDAAAARAGGYFADWIMQSVPSFLASETTEDVLIRTTFDTRLQRAAEEALATIFAEKVREGSQAQAAIVVMGADGAVRAMVGGRTTRVSGQFNRATQALRQTGSAFKPFVYATALELGYSPRATVVDEPLTLRVPGSGAWTPQNYSRTFVGRVTLTEALADSLNVPAVKVSEAVGRDNVRRIATDFGIESTLDTGPAVALGTSETTLLQMTAAYAGILNGGSSVTPYGLTDLRLVGDDAPLMGAEGGIGERVISERAARDLTWMMHRVVEDGTGRRARLEGREAAGKTGTTNSARDAWFIGFTADYVAGVWMGYDDNSPLTGVTGGGLPAEIWHETMLRVHDGLPARRLPMDPPTAAEPPRVASGNGTSGAASQGTASAAERAARSVGTAVEETAQQAGRTIGSVLRSIFGG